MLYRDQESEAFLQGLPWRPKRRLWIVVPALPRDLSKHYRSLIASVRHIRGGNAPFEVGVICAGSFPMSFGHEQALRLYWHPAAERWFWTHCVSRGTKRRFDEFMQSRASI